MALGIGLVPFTLQYVCLRAFYALEDTRTPFLLQIVIAGANVVIGVGVVVALDAAPLVAAGLALGYSLAYVLGVGISFRRLQKTLPALARRPVLALIGRTLIAAAPAALAAWLILRHRGRRQPAAARAGAGRRRRDRRRPVRRGGPAAEDPRGHRHRRHGAAPRARWWPARPAEWPHR